MSNSLLQNKRSSSFFFKQGEEDKELTDVTLANTDKKMNEGNIKRKDFLLKNKIVKDKIEARTIKKEMKNKKENNESIKEQMKNMTEAITKMGENNNENNNKLTEAIYKMMESNSKKEEKKKEVINKKHVQIWR